MEREELIIWVYLWVCDQVQAWREQAPPSRARLRRAGVAPALSDEEALTIELCGEMRRLHTDKAIYFHFKMHYQTWFPCLKDRPALVRQCANLWRLKLVLQERLLRQHEVALQPVQSVDTLPLPVCAKARVGRDKCFAGVAAKGYCAAKDLFYYGFKLGLRVCENGLIASYALLSANTHDCRHLPALVEGHQGLVPLDKGFFDPALWRRLWGEGVHVVGRGPKNVNKHRPAEVALPAPLEKMCARIRKGVEVVSGGRGFAFVHPLWRGSHPRP